MQSARRPASAWPIPRPGARGRARPKPRASPWGWQAKRECARPICTAGARFSRDWGSPRQGGRRPGYRPSRGRIGALARRQATGTARSESCLSIELVSSGRRGRPVAIGAAQTVHRPSPKPQVPSLKSRASSPEPSSPEPPKSCPPSAARQVLRPSPQPSRGRRQRKFALIVLAPSPATPGKANRGSQPGLPATRAATPQGEASRNPVCADRGQKECPVAAGANGALSSFRFLPSDAGLNLRGVRPRPDFRLSAARSIAISFARASIARAVALALREGGLTVRWRHAPSAGC